MRNVFEFDGVPTNMERRIVDNGENALFFVIKGEKEDLPVITRGNIAEFLEQAPNPTTARFVGYLHVDQDGALCAVVTHISAKLKTKED